MTAQTPTQRGAYRFGRSLQSESRDVYRDQTTVLDRGLHLDRQPGQWQEPKPEPSLAGAIEQSVRARMPLRSEPKSYRDYDTLAADYTASVELLRSATVQTCGSLSTS